MKTSRALSGVLVVLLAACVSTPVEDVTGNVGEGVEGEGGGEGEGEGDRDRERPGESEGVPGIGDPCTQDVCLDGQYLRVCDAYGEFAWDIDCTANRGECRRTGEREQCVAVGWDCETRCLEDNTIEICWSDLSVTRHRCDEPGDDGASFEGYVCDPTGAFDPMTGESSAVCVPGEGAESCTCDSYYTDGSFCCDPDCPCDTDCADGEPACGSQDDPAEEEEDPAEGGGGGGYAPEDWTCPATYYDAGDGCDCECGVYDPDCEDPDAEVFGCDEGEICSPPGECEPGEY